MDREKYETIVNQRIKDTLDALFPHGAGRASHTRVEHCLRQVAQVAFQQGRSYALNSILTADEALERLNAQLKKPISRRRFLALAKNRHERFGVGKQVGKTGVWLFMPEEIDVLVPGEPGRPTEEELMYDIYEKKINTAFGGPGVESLVVRDGVIVAHTRGWDDAAVVDDDWSAPLRGQPVAKRGKSWRKLRGFKLENAQQWAEDVIELQQEAQ